MFIYFPEYIYRKTKEFTNNTFKPKLNTTQTTTDIQNILNSIEFQKMINTLKENKIQLPSIDYKHCITLNSLKPRSDYDQIENKITICHNLVDKLDEYFKKEFIYFYETNITLPGKDKNIDNLSKMALKACRGSKLDHPDKILSYELIRRCAYYELKHRFGENDLELIKKYIEHNYFN